MVPRHPLRSGNTVRLAHPIVFVMDLGNPDALIPDLQPGTVSATSSCVSVRALADPDGDVTVRLERAPSQLAEGLTEVFRGAVETPTGRLAIVTSENQRVADIEVGARRTEVRIAVDAPDHPCQIVVAVVGAP